MTDMDTEFKRGQKVYDLHGGEYLYADRVEDGHYAYQVVTVQMTNYRGDDFDEDETEGPLLHLRQVFASPPKQKINEEITRLAEQKSELATHVVDLQREARQLEQKISGYKDDLEKEIRKYPHHQMFLHAASGGDLIILDDEFDRYDEVKRGTLTFDIGTGSFQGEWDANLDGRVPVVAFRSLHDAQQYFLRNQDLTVDPRTAKDLARKYRALELPLPRDLQEIVDEIKAKDRAAYRERLLRDLENTKKSLEKLESAG